MDLEADDRLIAAPLRVQRVWIDGRDQGIGILLVMACHELEARCGSAETAAAVLRGGYPLHSGNALHRAGPTPIPSSARYWR
jgi:hypothetical protein